MAGVGSTIDVSPFVGESRPADAATAAAIAEEWDQTFTSSGFAQIVGHGVDPALVAALRKAAADFFALPLEEKLAHQRELGEPASTTLGSYSPNSTVAPQLGGHDDPLEGYTFYRPPDGDWMRIMAPELGHPTALAAFAAMYAVQMERVLHSLHRLSAAALELPDSFFDAGKEPTNLLVISYYPPVTELPERQRGKPRYRAHSDYTGYTILLQDEDDHADDASGGLEIDIDGKWAPVVPQPGSFVINIGDLFHLWTNDRWRSTPHRVSSPALGSAAASRGRLIAAFFTGPSLETKVQPAPTCGEPKYPTLSAREFLTAMAVSKSKEAQYKAKAEADAEPAASGAADAVDDAVAAAVTSAPKLTVSDGGGGIVAKLLAAPWLSALGWGVVAALVALPYMAAYSGW